jgi:8-oxo-dGTP pyrophosphatase MutT (NUDIX family)
MTPFSRVKVRVGALVFCEANVALIRRDRPGGSHYTPPGGNVHAGEALLDALRRELAEELWLDLGDATPPELCWIQDQMVSRPGPTPPPRKLHMLWRCHVSPHMQERLAVEEYDDLPDGSKEVGVVEWVDYHKADALPLFPLFGAALAGLPSPTAPIGNPWLPPITDDNYTWV